MKRYFTLLLLTLSLYIHAADFNVKDYGATGNGATLDSRSIQQAIDACTQKGGGRVIFPAGQYLSGTIVLKNNVTLLLEKDALIMGSTNIEHYQNMDPFTDGLGSDGGWALVVAVDAKNIGIEGEGAIDGQGAKLKAQHTLTDTRGESKIWGRRPFLLRIVRCTGVTVRGVSLYYAAAWTSHYFQSKQVLIESPGCLVIISAM
jgi:polygalacturonase